MTVKKTIDADTALKARALFVMGQDHYRRCREYEMALADMLNYPPEDSYYMGYISDEMYNPTGSFDLALEREDFVMQERTTDIKPAATKGE